LTSEQEGKVDLHEPPKQFQEFSPAILWGHLGHTKESHRQDGASYKQWISKKAEHDVAQSPDDHNGQLYKNLLKDSKKRLGTSAGMGQPSSWYVVWETPP
jgi:hypothetical protein